MASSTTATTGHVPKTPSLSVDGPKDSRPSRGRGRGRGRGAGRANATTSSRPTAQLPAKPESVPKPERAIFPGAAITSEPAAGLPPRPRLPSNNSQSRQRRTSSNLVATTTIISTSTDDKSASATTQPNKRPAQTRRRSSKKSSLSTPTSTPSTPIPPPLLIVPNNQHLRGPISASLAPVSAGTGPPSRPYTPSSHIDWAEDDDEGELPDLDDWATPQIKTPLPAPTPSPAAPPSKEPEKVNEVKVEKKPSAPKVVEAARRRKDSYAEKGRKKGKGTANSTGMPEPSSGSTSQSGTAASTPHIQSVPTIAPEPTLSSVDAPSPLRTVEGLAQGGVVPTPSTTAPVNDSENRDDTKENIQSGLDNKSVSRSSSPPPDWSKAVPITETTQGGSPLPRNSGFSHQHHRNTPSPNRGSRRGGHGYSHSFSHSPQQPHPAKPLGHRHNNSSLSIVDHPPTKARSDPSFSPPPSRPHSRPIISSNALTQLTKSLGGGTPPNRSRLGTPSPATAETSS